MPRREFYEPELRELMVAVIEAYKEEGHKMKGKNKELIKQVKVLKDEEKTFVDQATGKVQN